MEETRDVDFPVLARLSARIQVFPVSRVNFPCLEPRMTPDEPKHEGDLVLVRRIAEGGRRALATLYDRHAERLYGLAISIVGSRADADEVVADAFMKVWSRADSFDPGRGTVATWLSVIVRSQALDHVRGIKRQRNALRRSAEADPDGISAPLGDANPSPDKRVLRDELRARLDRMLSEIPQEQRRILEFAYFDGLTQSEIAAASDLPLGTVKSRIRAGMQKLRESASRESGGGR